MANKGTPQGIKIGSPITIQRWLGYAERAGLIRIEGGSRVGLGHKASIWRTPDGTKRISDSSGKRPPLKENECGELDVLKTGGFHVSVNSSKRVFTYSRTTITPRRDKKIRKLEQQLISVVNDLYAEYRSRLEDIVYRKHGVLRSDWYAKNKDRHDFLLRRMNYQILKRDFRSYEAEIKRRRNRWKKTYARPEVEALAKDLHVSPRDLTDKLAKKRLRSVDLSELEHKEFLKLYEENHKLALAKEEVEQVLGPFAVLVSNYEFTDQLLVPPGRLIRTINHEYKNADDFVRGLSPNQIRRYEKVYWEAAFTRKYSKNVWFNSVDEDGRAVGGIPITKRKLGVDIGLEFPDDLLETQAMRRAYFAKVHAAFRAELQRRGLKELEHNHKASVQDIIKPLKIRHPEIRIMSQPIPHAINLNIAGKPFTLIPMPR